MKKTMKTILKAMLAVFMIVLLLPAIGKTLSADNQQTDNDQNVNDVPVDSISISPESTIMNVDDVVQIVATVSPNNATDKTVLWSVTSETSSVKLYLDESCSTEVGPDAIDRRAVYAKAVAAGDATVTVTSNDNAELSANCSVTVNDSGDFITVQPQDVIVSYPDGATFTVGVADESLVYSYQWHMIDQDRNDFVMDGETGNDPTLIVASTVQRAQKLLFYCVIRDTQGNTYTTRKASLDQDNRYTENKPVLYIGEYAIKPGEFLNLSAVFHDPEHQLPLGKGVITYDENGHDIYLDGIYFDNQYSTASIVGVGGNVGLDLEWQKPDPEVVSEINLILRGGENKIIDRLYQSQVNLSGFPVFFCFWGRDQQNGYTPMVNIIADKNDPGFLTVVNGTTAITAIAEMTIDADINVDQNRIEYGDGISAFSVDIKEGHKFNLHTNGSLISATGDAHQPGIKANLTIRNARIDAYSREPHVGTGATSKNGLIAHNNLTIEDSIINYQFEVDFVAGRIEEIAGCEFVTAINDIQIKNSKINLELLDHPDDIEHAMFAHHLIGIYGDTVDVDESEIRIDMTSPIVFQVGGLKGNNISITNGSKVNIDVETMEGAVAIYSEGDLTITDSDVDATAKNLTESDITPFAVSGADINIDLSEGNYVVANAVNAGGASVAIAGMHGPYLFDTRTGGTGPGAITLADDTSIFWPLNCEIGTKETDVIKEKEKIKIVTVVDKTTQEIMSKVEIAAYNKEKDRYAVIEGKAASWGENRNSVLRLKIERSAVDNEITYHFSTVEVDGNLLDDKFYYTERGCLEVNIKPEFLRQLSAGDHTLSVVFNDGRVDSVFTVVPQRYIPPVTGIE